MCAQESLLFNLVEIHETGLAKIEFDLSYESEELESRELNVVGLVTDRNSTVSSYGAKIETISDIDPARGVVCRLQNSEKQRVECAFSKNVNVDQEYEILLFDTDGDLVQRIPIVRNYTMPYWNKRISREIVVESDLQEFQAPVRIVLARSDVLVAKNEE